MNTSNVSGNRICAMSLLLLLLLGAALFSPPPAWSDCKSDCQGEYQSEVESCKTQFEDPDDANDLQACFDDATRDYQSCLEECENETEISLLEFCRLLLDTIRGI